MEKTHGPSAEAWGQLQGHPPHPRHPQEPSPQSQVHEAAHFSPLLQLAEYWRYLADAYRDMAHEGIQELLHSLGPPPQPTDYRDLPHHPQLPPDTLHPSSLQDPQAPGPGP